MADFRVEKDPLGELAVPAAALYGVQTERARQNFPISGRPLPPDPWSPSICPKPWGCPGCHTQAQRLVRRSGSPRSRKRS